MSFGYDRGAPPEADIVVDVRGMSTPKACVWQVSGKNDACAEQVREAAAARIRSIVARAREGKTVAIGCSAGRHRSVAIADAVAKELGVRASHRDL